MVPVPGVDPRHAAILADAVATAKRAGDRLSTRGPKNSIHDYGSYSKPRAGKGRPFAGQGVIVALTDTDRDQVVGLVRDFAAAEVAPRVRDYDRDEHLPVDILRATAELGFLGGTVNESWGGMGPGNRPFAAVIEGISRVDLCPGVRLSMPSALVGAGGDGGLHLAS
jgi:alkylation response protein AidB-like acyl-CoA dehydrogenase